ncbi:MAG: CvpA family protein [Bacteroidota bacterium]
MNYLDIVLAVPLAYGAIRGFYKGFIIEIASLASLIMGVFIAVIVSDIAGQILVAMVEWNPLVIKIIAFIIAFSLVVFVVHLFAKSLEKIVKITGLNIFNRIGGLFAGLVKILFFLSVIILLMNNFMSSTHISIVSEKTREESILYYRIENFAHKILPDKEFLQKYNPFNNKKESSEEEESCEEINNID